MNLTIPVPVAPLSHVVDNCFLAALAIIARAVRGQHEAVLSSLWFFDLIGDERGPRLGDRIVDLVEAHAASVLETVYEIRYAWGRSAGFGELQGVIEASLVVGRPIGVMINTGYCPWSPKYQKDLGQHMIIVIGRRNSGYSCVDSISSNVEYIDDATLSLGCTTNSRISGRYLRCDFAAGVASDPYERLTMLYGSGAFTAARRGMVERIRQFASLLMDANLSSEVSGCKTLEAVPLLYRMAFVADGRINFARFLRYFEHAGAEPSVRGLAEQLDGLGKLWLTARNLLVRAAFSDEGRAARTVDGVMAEIARAEERALECLQESLGW